MSLTYSILTYNDYHAVVRFTNDQGKVYDRRIALESVGQDPNSPEFTNIIELTMGVIMERADRNMVDFVTPE